VGDRGKLDRGSVSCARVKLYICWGTFNSPRPGGHPCRNAYEALRRAGHDPELIKSYGLGILGPLNVTEGRREAKRLTGSYTVPVLVTDDGEVVADSKKIIDWAERHPAAAATV
jgi:Glutathione S-transferase, N-terminal domain